MKYVFPIFPGRKIGPLRLSSWGLGNLLFPFARAIKYADEYNLQPVWPTWSQLHIGSWLRREPDKRMYSNLFKKTDYWASSIPTGIVRFKENDLSEFLAHTGDACLEVDNFMVGLFEPLLGYNNHIWHKLATLSRYDLNAARLNSKGTIGVHIRLGDMKKKPDWLTPLNWYSSRIQELKSINPDLRFIIYSDDAGDMLQNILAMPNVSRSPAARPAILDIASLAGSDAVISGKASTFSRWAVYLGGNPVIALASDEYWRRSWDKLSTCPISLCGDEKPIKHQLELLLNPRPLASQ